MMKNLSVLTKINLKKTFGSEVKGVSSGVFTLLKALLFTAFFSYLNYVFANMGQKAGQAPIKTTVMMCGFATFLTLVYGIASAKSLFASSDYEMLSTMPITKGEIVASKIIVLYITELMYSATMLIPNAVVTSIYAGSAVYAPGIFFAAFLIPALPIAVGCVIGLLLTLLTSKSRAGNAIMMILYLLFFGGMIAVAMMINIDQKMNGGGNTLNSLGFMSYVNPTALLLEATYTYSPLYYLPFVAANLAIMAVTVIFIAVLFDKAHAAVSRGNTAAAKVKRYKAKGQASALMGHEVKRFFSSQAYWMQVIIAPLMCVVMAVFFAIAAPAMLDEPKVVGMIGSVVFMLLILSITVPSVVSISIEGKNFYMIKSMPVRYKTYAWVKILFNTAIDLIGALAACIIAVVAFRPGIAEGACLFVVAVAFSFGANAVGVSMNLRRCRLDWVEEKEAFKDTAATFLSLLVNGGVTLATCAAAIILSLAVEPYLIAMGVAAGAALVFAIVAIAVTLNTAEKKIEKIEV